MSEPSTQDTDMRYNEAVVRIKQRLHENSSLPETADSSVVNGLRYYTREEQLNEYFCQVCNEGCRSSRSQIMNSRFVLLCEKNTLIYDYTVLMWCLWYHICDVNFSIIDIYRCCCSIYKCINATVCHKCFSWAKWLMFISELSCRIRSSVHFCFPNWCNFVYF